MEAARHDSLADHLREPRALDKARALWEAKARRALEGREAQLRIRLELEAKVRATELEQRLERNAQATVKSAVEKANRRARRAMAAAVAILLALAGVYGLVVAPRMERQTVEIERMRQEASVMQHENESLAQKVVALERKLESMRPRQTEVAPLPPTQN